MTTPQSQSVEAICDDFRKQFDELGLKAPKKSMPGLERELIVDYWRKVLHSHTQAVKEAASNDTLREERQFILNVLNGIDSVDGPQATSAIRKMLDARYVGQIVL